ncbi:MAG TPA: hypothetical protein P5567_09585 [Kiritimatiellia bacterium]|nr:hypothetical protein [Kiritimatiellia bacterium]HRZ12691.1 hypothetical protein [Kiritimatiellia bacterium]HSA19541.1 hypothetical protein [Kiritimatiellia bacterium]
MKKGLAVLLMLAAAARAEERFMLSDPEVGAEYGPFVYEDGAILEVYGRPLTLRRLDTKADALKQKMEQITLPSIEFRNAALPDVVQFLVDASVAGDPEGTGVNIVLPPEPAAGEAAPRTVTLSLRRVSLYDALALVAEVSGLSVRLDERGVVLLEAGGRAGGASP